MAIYISGVKGLPEQVQANKEDIKQIKEDIANIDFDAIRELEAQVDENTNDINNLENGQGVQDQAINGLGDRVGTAEGKITQLETDTQKITYNSTDDETRIQGTTRIAVIKNNRIGDDDSEIRFGTNQGIVLKQGTHTLNYDDDGKLYLDGVELSPAPVIPPKYQHFLKLINNSLGVITAISVIKNDNNPMTLSDLASYLYNNGFRDSSAFYPCQARVYIADTIATGLYSFNGTSVEFTYRKVSDASSSSAYIQSLVNTAIIEL